MGRSARWIGATLIGFSLVGVLAWSATGGGLPAERRAAPTAVGVLNLDVLFADLTELQTRREALQAKLKEVEAEPARLLEEMRRIDEELSTLNLSPQEQLDRRLRLGVLNQQHQAQVKAAQLLIEIEMGRLFREAYQKALPVIERVAQREGLDFVLLDDRAIKVPEGQNASSRDVQAAILARQVLYAAESVDVTKLVAGEMNNDYKMGR